LLILLHKVRQDFFALSHLLILK